MARRWRPGGATSARGRGRRRGLQWLVLGEANTVLTVLRTRREEAAGGERDKRRRRRSKVEAALRGRSGDGEARTRCASVRRCRR